MYEYLRKGYEIGLTPSQFWDMEGWEFTACCEGYADRVFGEREFLAVMFCMNTNVHLPKGKGIKPNDIIQKKKKIEKITDEEARQIKKDIEEAREEFVRDRQNKNKWRVATADDMKRLEKLYNV